VLGILSPLAAASSGSSSGFGFVFVLIAMAAVFYFLLIRPQQRRQRQQRQLIESVEVGDEVMTIGGLFGTVNAIDDESVTLEVSPGVELRFAKSAVARKLVYDEDDDREEADDLDEADDRDHQEEGAGEQS